MAKCNNMTRNSKKIYRVLLDRLTIKIEKHILIVQAFKVKIIFIKFPQKIRQEKKSQEMGSNNISSNKYNNKQDNQSMSQVTMRKYS